MLNGNRQYAAQQRGDWVNRVKATGRRVPLRATFRRGEQGFSLIELVITVTVMTILTLGVMPLVRVAVQRQKEQRLRETLRNIRSAIDEFRRDTVGMVCAGPGVMPGGGGGGGQIPGGQVPGTGFIDPRSKVVISDCTIFGIDNPDHYPPDLQTLVDGVNVIPRGQMGAMGGRGQMGVNATDLTSQVSTKVKIYLREIPIDPVTGEREWEFRSSYDPADSTSWGGENVFDVRSKSKEKALNGDNYSDW
jgi:general secretion pathway protein G